MNVIFDAHTFHAVSDAARKLHGASLTSRQTYIFLDNARVRVI